MNESGFISPTAVVGVVENVLDDTHILVRPIFEEELVTVHGNEADIVDIKNAFEDKNSDEIVVAYKEDVNEIVQI